MSHEEDSIEIHKFTEKLKSSFSKDLSSCVNKDCEFFGKTSRVNFAFAGGGKTLRCYHCYIIIPKPVTNSV